MRAIIELLLYGMTLLACLLGVGGVDRVMPFLAPDPIGG